MKSLKVSEILRRLYADGWTLKATRGSHRQLVHPVKRGKVTVNGHNSDDVCGFLLRSIEKQAGVTF